MTKQIRKNKLKIIKNERREDGFLNWIQSKMLLLNGNTDEAMRKLLVALENIQMLPPELQTEMYRDIALDPIYLPLRNETQFLMKLVDVFGDNSPVVLP